MSSPILKKEKGKRGEEGKKDAGGFVFISRERDSHFSLDLRAIRPSAVFGTRRKTALRGEVAPYLGTGFEEFRQTPRGRGFSLLGFYSLFKSYVNV